MAIKLLVDSASDISLEEANAMGIDMIPMTISFDEEEYRDGVDLTKREFFEKLIESRELPKTSQINMFQFEERMRELTADGSEVVAVTLSSKLSGTYTNAVQAAEAFDGKVHVLDSLNASAGERILVQHALRLIKKGLTAQEVVHQLEEVRGRIRFIALLDTLEYLQKGGRVSAITAMTGTALHIKPVISVTDGEVKSIGKAIGSKKGNNLLMQTISKCGGIDFDMPYEAVFSGLEDSLLQKYLQDSAALWQDEAEHVPSCCIGSTIGTHIGPGAIGVAFFAKEGLC